MDTLFESRERLRGINKLHYPGKSTRINLEINQLGGMGSVVCAYVSCSPPLLSPVPPAPAALLHPWSWTASIVPRPPPHSTSHIMKCAIWYT